MLRARYVRARVQVDRDAMLDKLAEQLYLHTLDWSSKAKEKRWGKDISHWATIKSVEVCIPSQCGELRLWDVPGFGDVTGDPYRQSIIREALAAPASMLLFCCHP